MIKHIWRVSLVFVLYLSGPLFLLLTNPKNLSLPLLIFPFLWLFVSIIYGLTGLYKLLAGKPVGRRLQLNFGLIALVPVLLAILQSIHQLSIKDIVLVLGLVAVASFYVSKLDVGPNEG